jgi:hypothetical protein
MSNEATHEPRDADELGQYRSLSTLAVAAFLLGLGSVLVFAAPALVAIPLTAIAIASLALAKIHSSAGSLTGSLLARSGIVLAIVFTVAAFTHVYVRDSLSIRLASNVAQEWLSFVSTGEIDAALEVMTPSALLNLRPRSAGEDLPDPPFDRQQAIEMLREDPLVHAIEPAQKSAEVLFRSTDGIFYWVALDPEVGCRFEAAGTRSPQVEFSMVLKRILSPQRDVVWLVDSWKLINPSPAEL